MCPLPHHDLDCEVPVGYSPPGPCYAETNPCHTIVEPFNAVSAALFLVVVGFWLWKVRSGFFRPYWFITSALIVMGIGGIGGTIFHAFRGHVAWLMMDVLPILVLALAAAVYFWYRIFRNWIIVIGITGTLIGITALVIWLIRALTEGRGGGGPAFGYVMMASYAVVPIVVWLVRSKWKHAGWAIVSVVSFAAAYIFRTVDKLVVDVLPMGTHFLWHIFGAITAAAMVGFVYSVINSDRQNPSVTPKPGDRPGTE